MERNLNNTYFRARFLIDLLISSEIRQRCIVCSSQYFRDYVVVAFFPPELYDPICYRRTSYLVL